MPSPHSKRCGSVLLAGLALACAPSTSAQVDAPETAQTEQPAEFEPVFVEAAPTASTLEETQASEPEPRAVEPPSEPEALPEGLSEEQLEKRAGELYVKGLIEYRAGRYTEALGFFEHAFSLVPKPELAYNIAQTHEKLGNRREACSAYVRVVGVSERGTPTRVKAELRHEKLGC